MVGYFFLLSLSYINQHTKTMEKLKLTADTPIGYDNIVSPQLRSDIEHAYINGGNDEDKRLEGFYLTPKGSISGDSESFAIDLEDEEGNAYETYLYSSAHEYIKDVVTLGLDIFMVDYGCKVLYIYWGGEFFMRDLNEGDVGDFWHTLRSEVDNDIVKDINFYQEDEEQEPTLALYGVKETKEGFEVDSSDEYIIENYIQVGKPENYFGSDMKFESINPKKVIPYDILSMVQIPKEDILPSIMSLLEGRESFRDTDNILDERIYTGDIFEQILDTTSGHDEETENKLSELNSGCKDINYIQLIY